MKPTARSKILPQAVAGLLFAGEKKRSELDMEEKTYKTMGGSGALNITIGVVTLVVGVAAGVLLIISGAKLLAGRNKIIF